MFFPLDVPPLPPEPTGGEVSALPLILLAIAAAVVVFFIIVQLRRIVRRPPGSTKDPDAER